MRIIAGSHRGRRIEAPPGEITRPTSDRVREALFSRLSAHCGSLEGHTVLDAYAGSGALGLEALSRGAEHVTFVERDRAAATALTRNIDTLGLKNASTVLIGNVERFAATNRVGGPFSLLFLDPPYKIRKAEVRGVIETLLESGVVLPDAIVVWEYATRDAPDWPSGFHFLGSRVYGSTEVDIAIYQNAEEDE